MPETKVITILLPTQIDENYQFKEVNEVNDLLHNGFSLFAIDQTVRLKGNDKEFGLVLTMIKHDQPVGFYVG